MNFQTLEDIRLFVGGKVRQDRIAAQNSRSNGYVSVALQHENEAEFGDRILKALATEKTDAR